ncbi:hypothetical protein K7X08_014930 [Anisodus acutangulus]|uniref:Uncharacterized protein n=1 Tax=Anisodus acutangulus TaxID=402998 RepID=A0A9Q1R3D5_9SOLA|nr:hypothetical protein K7X08_014930 [Anisodus acutangulus]
MRNYHARILSSGKVVGNPSKFNLVEDNRGFTMEKNRRKFIDGKSINGNVAYKVVPMQNKFAALEEESASVEKECASAKREDEQQKDDVHHDSLVHDEVEGVMDITEPSQTQDKVNETMNVVVVSLGIAEEPDRVNEEADIALEEGEISDELVIEQDPLKHVIIEDSTGIIFHHIGKDIAMELCSDHKLDMIDIGKTTSMEYVMNMDKQQDM